LLLAAAAAVDLALEGAAKLGEGGDFRPVAMHAVAQHEVTAAEAFGMFGLSGIATTYAAWKNPQQADKPRGCALAWCILDYLPGLKTGDSSCETA